jgi:hypothetical protein
MKLLREQAEKQWREREAPQAATPSSVFPQRQLRFRSGCFANGLRCRGRAKRRMGR